MLDERARWRWLPRWLSLLRLALGPLFVLALEIHAELPLAIALLAAASDFVDGRLARGLGVASRSGAVLDVLGDGVFVVLALAALATVGVVSWLLPAAVVLALAGLVVAWAVSGVGSTASAARARGPADRAGHLAGIVNYGAVLVGSLVVAGALDAAWVLPASVGVACLNLSPLVLRVARQA